MAAVVLPMDLPPKYQRQGTTTQTLTIAKRTGHRRTLKDFFVKAGASGSVDIQVGNSILARIFHNLAQAVLVAGLNHRHGDMGFLAYLASMIPDLPRFTGGQDEDIVITASAAVTRQDAYFEDQVEGDVVSRNLPGGSQGRKHLFILNLSNGTAIAVDGVYQFDRFDMPTGLSMFTDGKRMSANNRFTLYGVAGNFPKNVASRTTRVHIKDEFTELFTSENNEGLHADPDNENELEFDLSPLKKFWLKEPYVWEPNKILTITGEADIAGADALAIGTQQLFLIGVRELLGGGA